MEFFSIFTIKERVNLKIKQGTIYKINKIDKINRE